MLRKDLRRCVIFGRNDLVQDAPVSRIDLLACRNTLMQAYEELQSTVEELATTNEAKWKCCQATCARRGVVRLIGADK